MLVYILFHWQHGKIIEYRAKTAERATRFFFHWCSKLNRDPLEYHYKPLSTTSKA